MQSGKLTVVHYVNQFFGGIGGEDKADVGPQVKAGPIGPGRALQAQMGERAQVVATVICGDNYFAERIDEATVRVIELIEPYRPDVLIAGPAFDAGRYGIACGAVCRAVEKRLGIPVVTGMHRENPGVDMFARDVYIVETAESVTGMNAAVARMTAMAFKLTRGEDIGRPADSGYFPRGFLVNVMAQKDGATRVVDMLLAKLKGDPFESEVTLPKYDAVIAAPKVSDLTRATIALVTDGGLVPKGNPDRIENRHATRFGAYRIDLVDVNRRDGFQVVHGGYDDVFVREDPNRLLPVDVMRDLEQEGIIGKVHDKFYSTSGLASVVKNSEKMGQGIAQQLKDAGVSAAILTST